MDRGFDSFFGFLGGGSFYFPPGNRDSIANILDGREAAAVGRYLTDEFGDRAVRFIKESAGGPFFPLPRLQCAAHADAGTGRGKSRNTPTSRA